MRLRLCIVAVFLALLSTRSPSFAGNQVTILYDGFGEAAPLIKDWGFAALVEYKEAFGNFGSSLPVQFFRKVELLPESMCYFDGRPPETLRFGTAWNGATFVPIGKTTEVAPGHCTGNPRSQRSEKSEAEIMSMRDSAA